MGPHDTTAAVGSDEFLLQIMNEKLTAAAVRKNKAIVLKMRGLLEVMYSHLLQEWSHIGMLCYYGV